MTTPKPRKILSEENDECDHQFRYNKEKDFVFCEFCGERWNKHTMKKEKDFVFIEKDYIPPHYPPPYPKYPVVYC